MYKYNKNNIIHTYIRSLKLQNKQAIAIERLRTIKYNLYLYNVKIFNFIM